MWKNQFPFALQFQLQLNDQENEAALLADEEEQVASGIDVIVWPLTVPKLTVVLHNICPVSPEPDQNVKFMLAEEALWVPTLEYAPLIA